jgi:hypothetical protein
MNTRTTTRGITRRRLLQATAAGLAGLGPANRALAQSIPDHTNTVRDRLWIFTCAANADYANVGQRSLMTPVEGALYFEVPNIIVVQSSVDEARYARLEPPLAQYTIAMRPLKRVAWSVVGSGRFMSAAETKEVLELAKTTPNFVGIMLDDYFISDEARDESEKGKLAALTVDELAELRRQLREIHKKLEIMATLYSNQLDFSIGDHLALIDAVSLWTGKPAELANLESNLKKLEKLAPKSKKLLGCYLVDYGEKKAVAVDAMRHQCETGLRWLKEGRLDGMIFLGNTVMDLGFECVEWTRQWIRKVGDTKL